MSSYDDLVAAALRSINATASGQMNSAANAQAQFNAYNAYAAQAAQRGPFVQFAMPQQNIATEAQQGLVIEGTARRIE